MATVLSVNLGSRTSTRHNDSGITGIDKRPSPEPVLIRDPGPRTGMSGLPGDLIGDPQSHGGTDQAVYAFPREELDVWQAELGRPLPGGVFGENLTTLGLDVNSALVGERWRIGRDCVLEVTSPRIPCNTFATWLEEQRWVRRFTERGNPGAYLRVITPGLVGPGDEIDVVYRPAHDVTIAMMFRALTTEKSLQPQLAAAGEALPEDLRRRLVPAGWVKIPVVSATSGTAVWPSLRYRDANAAIAFLVEAFGFEEVEVYRSDDDRVVDHAELRWPLGGGVMLGQVRPETGSDVGSIGGPIYVTVSDPDALYARATAHGATITRELIDEDYGSREFSARDPQGVDWSFGTYAGGGSGSG